MSGEAMCEHGVSERVVCRECIDAYERDRSTDHEAPTLRDQFAMAALASIISVEPPEAPMTANRKVERRTQFAYKAYRYADAMLSARENGESDET